MGNNLKDIISVDVNKEIAIIMPVYKAHKTIVKSLASVLLQDLLKYHVYLIIDGEEKGSYDYLLDIFPNEPMTIHYKKENGGAGSARNTGIEISEEPLLAFIDSDDKYSASNSLFQIYYPLVNDDNTVMVASPLLKENSEGEFSLYTESLTWTHGKIYRRDFLNKYNIRFIEGEYSTNNEDVGFNSQVICLINNSDDKDINITQRMISYPIYIFKHNDDSVTSTWTDKHSLKGFAANKIFAFEHIYGLDVMSDIVAYHMVKGIENIYENYMSKMIEDEDKSFIDNIGREYIKRIWHMLDNYKHVVEKELGSNFEDEEEKKKYIEWFERIKEV